MKLYILTFFLITAFLSTSCQNEDKLPLSTQSFETDSQVQEYLSALDRSLVLQRSIDSELFMRETSKLGGRSRSVCEKIEAPNFNTIDASVQEWLQLNCRTATIASNLRYRYNLNNNELSQELARARSHKPIRPNNQMTQ